MKTRDEIISAMCFTMRHDFGLTKESPLDSGMTEEQRNRLWRDMAQLFDNNIAPYMEFKE